MEARQNSGMPKKGRVPLPRLVSLSSHIRISVSTPLDFNIKMLPLEAPKSSQESAPNRLESALSKLRHREHNPSRKNFQNPKKRKE